jgi:CRISPR/Cas system-associated protein Cas10 (large subunit of type III CRISPR-Cas system)
MSTEQRPDPTKFRCRLCRELRALDRRIERQDLPIVVGPTGNPEFERLCSFCRPIQQRHNSRRKLNRDLASDQELHEMCRLRDELRASGVDRATACSMAAELSVAVADPPAFIDWLKGRRSADAA